MLGSRESPSPLPSSAWGEGSDGAHQHHAVTHYVGVTRNRSSQKDQAIMDYDRMAAEYARNRQVHPGVLNNLLSIGGIGADSRVLEVGCGTGNYVVTLEVTTGSSCWAIDPSEQMLSRAKRRSEMICFQIGVAERLDFPSGTFDLVFSVDVIHHVTDRPAYFREAHRVLHGDGKVCTVTDSEWILQHRRPLTVYFPETVSVELGRYPRMAELRDLMERSGFGEIGETCVEFAYQLDDIRAYREKAFSALHLISEEAFRRGITRMENDLENGPIPCVSYYVLLWGTKRPDCIASRSNEGDVSGATLTEDKAMLGYLYKGC
jgi:ubiquinone/menaquinone biosynthesis C-methylase UbiE